MLRKRMRKAQKGSLEVSRLQKAITVTVNAIFRGFSYAALQVVVGYSSPIRGLTPKYEVRFCD
jgi:hypothetical protein